MSEKIYGEITTNSDGSVKDIANVLKKATINDTLSDINGVDSLSKTSSTFKVCSNNLPAKTSVWTKIKNILFYEVKVELTPHQQKIEDEINEFLHQEVTWKSFKDFWMQKIEITL